MIPGALAKRYATALFAVARERGRLEEVRGDFQGIVDLLDSNRRLFNFLLSPQVRTEDKKEMLESTLRGQVEDILADFLELLIDKKRFDHVREIFTAFVDLYEDYVGIVEVVAVTALPLPEDLERKMVAKLESQLGKKIRLSKEVDPEIIGGMVLRIENKVIDGSVKYSLEKLRRNLKQVKVY